MRTRSVLFALVTFFFITVLLFPAKSYANSDNDHQHQRILQRIVTDDESETPLCGEFYCKECHEPYYDSITYDDLGIPIVNINGSLAGISKTQKVTVNISYESDQLVFNSDATLKLQGASSLGYPKKNYSVQFVKANGKKNKTTLVDSWGSQSKYCLKANYVDYSQSRNVVSGRLFNEVLHSRNINDELNELSNGGVVDGYPVAVFLNEKYLGLYTMNIPKDKWMFGMDDDTIRQALLFGDIWAESVKLKEPISDVNNVSASGWDLEYCSTEEDESIGTSWVAESMNDFIGFLNSNDGDDFKNGIDQYTDIDRAIDVLIYTYFIQARDNVSKNIIWATYNGIKWIPSVYDMDGSWGMAWDGSFPYSASEFPPSDGNLLFKRLIDNCSEEIEARYAELRQSILSNSNIQMLFASFFADIPQVMYTAESEKWTGVPSQDVNNFDQIIGFAKARTEYLDNYYNVTVDEAGSDICKVTFNGSDGIKVFTYESQDYEREPKQNLVAFARDEEGKIAESDGQVNFLVVPPKGYLVDTVTAAPEDGFKELKGEEETGKENTYRITEIEKDLIVNIDIKEHSEHVSSGNVKYAWASDYSTCKASDVCSICGLEYGETVEPVYTEEKAASCLQEGVGKYTAHFESPIFEDQEEEVIIETAEHTLVAVEGKDATPTEPGYKAYWKCSVCNKLFSDAEGKNEISEPIVIDPVDPTPEEPVDPTPVDPTPVDPQPTPVDPQPAPVVTPTVPAAPAEIVDLPAVKISKPKAAKKKITVKWKKVSKKNLKKIQGIEIQVATDPGFTNIVKTETAGKKKTSKVIKGLTSKQTYYVRIRVYKYAADGKHVSAWKAKKAKVK